MIGRLGNPNAPSLGQDKCVLIVDKKNACCKVVCSISHKIFTWVCLTLFCFSYTNIRPMEPRALAWDPTNFHTKSFQLERHRLKIDEKIINSLSNLYLPIQCIFPYLLYKFHIVALEVHMRNPDFFCHLVATAARFVVLRPCWLNSDLLSGPKGN